MDLLLVSLSSSTVNGQPCSDLEVISIWIIYN